jgi:hypothetical protein
MKHHVVPSTKTSELERDITMALYKTFSSFDNDEA